MCIRDRHVGVLLDNTPEYPLWLSAAALARAAVAGINPTRRGAELARDILHTECRILVTERAHLPLLTGLRLPGVRVVVTGSPEYDDLLAPYADARPDASPARPGDRLLLYFTSGSTGAPKAALCSQGRLAAQDVRWPASSPYAPTTCTTSACRCSTATRSSPTGRPPSRPERAWRCAGGSPRPGSCRTYGPTGRRTSRTWGGRSSTSSPPSRAPTTRTIRCGSASARRRGRWTRRPSSGGSGCGWWRGTARRRAARRSSGGREPRPARSARRPTDSWCWIRPPARSARPLSSTRPGGC